MTKSAFVFTHGTKRRRCPICRRRLDAATAVSTDAEDPTPKLEAGCITCCAYCGSVLIVTTAGFRLATEADLADLDPPLRQMLLAFSAQRAAGPQ